MGRQEESRMVGSVKQLEEAVHAMRRLGVVKWGDIELGPDPTPGLVGESDTTQADNSFDLNSMLYAASEGPVRK
jgi:hypothetical protein